MTPNIIKQSETYKTDNEQQTRAVARQLAATLQPGEVVALYGDVGAGKTAFFKGVAEHFGINEIASPTYTLMLEYHAALTLYHFDAYRIGAAEWESLGFDDYLYSDGVCFIEWAENVRDLLECGTINVTLTREGDYRRNITITRNISNEGQT